MKDWKVSQKRSLETQLRRAIHLERCNIDYQILHPSESRSNPDRKVLKQCHPEAKVRILKKHEKWLAVHMVPSVIRPKRLNRLG